MPEAPELSDDPITQLLSSQPTPTPEPSPNEETQPAQISFHALMGHSIPQTLRVLGQIHKAQVAVLIDGGSTNNFIQDKVAKNLGLPLQLAQSSRCLWGTVKSSNVHLFVP